MDDSQRDYSTEKLAMNSLSHGSFLPRILKERERGCALLAIFSALCKLSLALAKDVQPRAADLDFSWFCKLFGSSYSHCTNEMHSSPHRDSIFNHPCIPTEDPSTLVRMFDDSSGRFDTSFFLLAPLVGFTVHDVSYAQSASHTHGSNTQGRSSVCMPHPAECVSRGAIFSLPRPSQRSS